MSMLRFTKLNPTAFVDQKFEYAIMFAVMKMLGGLLCYFANICIIMRSESIEDIVKDYIAVEIISNIDNIMAQTIIGDENI